LGRALDLAPPALASSSPPTGPRRPSRSSPSGTDARPQQPGGATGTARRGPWRSGAPRVRRPRPGDTGPPHQSRPSRSRSASRSSSAKIDSGAGSPTWALISWTSCRSRSAAAWSPTSSEAHCTRTRSPHARRGRARRALPGVAAPGSGRRVRHHRCQARTHVLGGRAPEPARAQCWHVNTPVSGHALARLRVQRAAHPTRG
jgi:hypothetical protein